jgi:hypothetical protein
MPGDQRRVGGGLLDPEPLPHGGGASVGRGGVKRRFQHDARYENGLSRSLLRNLHELQRLHAIRAGELVAAPTVIDVDVNISENRAANPRGNFTKQTHLATRCDAAGAPPLAMAESQGK